MSNQLHGVDFQNRIIEEHLNYPETQAVRLNYGLEWDFKGYDSILTQVKTKQVKNKNKIDDLALEMASAPKFVNIGNDFKLIVGLFIQQEDVKEFFQILEWTKITLQQFCQLRGELLPAEVEKFDCQIKEFAYGKHVAARLWAEKRNQIIKNTYSTKINLHPKIGAADNQRRLQCSVRIKDLKEVCGQPQIYKIGENYMNLSLPFEIHSGSRILKSKKIKLFQI